jgi:hypothetical protein
MMLLDTENVIALILIIMSLVLNIIYIIKLKGIRIISPIVLLGVTGFYAYTKFILDLDMYDVYAMGGATGMIVGTLLQTIIF